MPWKSRIGKDPPATFFAQAAAQMARAHEGVAVTREVMTTLRPYLADAWREGANAKKAVDTMCSCDGKTIFPSPSVAVRLLKGEVRPPQGAQRGQVFGVEELRESAELMRLRKEVAQAQRRVAQATEQVEQAEAREQQARSAESRARAAQRLYQILEQKREALVQLAAHEKRVGEYLRVQERERERLERERAAQVKAAAPPERPQPATAPYKEAAKPVPRLRAPQASESSVVPAPKGDAPKPAAPRKKAGKPADLPTTPKAVARAAAKLVNPEDL